MHSMHIEHGKKKNQQSPYWSQTIVQYTIWLNSVDTEDTQKNTAYS